MACGMTTIKRFTYRGAIEEYSNQYWFTGDAPSSPTDWRALFDALCTQEKTVYRNDTELIGGYGYDSDADGATAVWSVDLTVSPEVVIPGTLTVTGGAAHPGDVAVWARWKTSRLNTKGKAVYLRKYFHGAYSDSAVGVDTILPNQKTKLTDFATKLKDGTFISARTITARGHTDTILSVGASSYLTTRTLKRRGRRPTG